MLFEEKLGIAHSELKRGGVSNFSSNPPGYKLLRKMGIKIPPPQYCRVFPTIILWTLYLGPIWFVLSKLIVTPVEPKGLIYDFGVAFLVGLVTGIGTSLRNKYLFKKLKLTPWKDLNRDDL